MPDNLSEAGARALAQRITKFWAERGRSVSAWVEPIYWIDGKLGNTTAYSVRSNLIGGLPNAKVVPMKSAGLESNQDLSSALSVLRTLGAN
jgi:hypothetical protein